MIETYKIHCKVHDQQERVIEVGIGNKKFSVLTVWNWIDNNEYQFYTEDVYGNKAEVKIGVSPLGRKFLTTSPDGITDNNLDELPGCSAW